MIPRLLFGMLVIAGCESFPDPSGFPDPDGPQVPVTVSETRVCEALVACGLWFGQESCEADRLQPGACIDRVGYLGCMTGCVDRPCAELQQCEPVCWRDHCARDLSPRQGRDLDTGG